MMKIIKNLHNDYCLNFKRMIEKKDKSEQKFYGADVMNINMDSLKINNLFLKIIKKILSFIIKKINFKMFFCHATTPDINSLLPLSVNIHNKYASLSWQLECGTRYYSLSKHLFRLLEIWVIKNVWSHALNLLI